MGSSRSTSGPFALYCRTTMSVAAGAVAVAMAPSVMACAMDSLPFVSSAITISAISTRNVAASACKTPMTNACLPVCFSSDTRNSLPMENAMKPSATSEISDRLSTDSCVGKPRPSMPSRPRQYGRSEHPQPDTPSQTVASAALQRGSSADPQEPQQIMITACAFQIPSFLLFAHIIIHASKQNARRTCEK